MLENIWLIQVQVIPVVLVMLLLETPNIFRAIYPIPYVPVYFSLYPFNVLNEDLSIYLNEDTFYGRGEDLSETELQNYKRIIFQKAALSLIISLALIPFIGGFISSFFLPQSSLVGFSLIFISYKLIGIVRAAIGFRFHSICNFKSMSLYILVYCLYFLIFLTLFFKSYKWAVPFIQKEDWAGLVNGLIDLFVFDFFFMTIAIGGLVALLLKQVTDRKFRHEHATESTTETPE